MIYIPTQWHLLLHIIESRISRCQFTLIYKKHLLALYNVFWSRRLTFHFTVLICNSDSERNYLKLDFIRQKLGETMFVCKSLCFTTMEMFTPSCNECKHLAEVSDPPHNQIRLLRPSTEQSLIWRWRWSSPSRGTSGYGWIELGELSLYCCFTTLTTELTDTTNILYTQLTTTILLDNWIWERNLALQPLTLWSKWNLSLLSKQKSLWWPFNETRNLI